MANRSSLNHPFNCRALSSRCTRTHFFSTEEQNMDRKIINALATGVVTASLALPVYAADSADRTGTSGSSGSASQSTSRNTSAGSTTHSSSKKAKSSKKSASHKSSTNTTAQPRNDNETAGPGIPSPSPTANSQGGANAPRSAGSATR